jgi:hypothetical protein
VYAVPVSTHIQVTGTGISQVDVPYVNVINSGFTARVAAGLTTAGNGDFGYDTTAKNWHFFSNAVDNINVVSPSSLTITNNDCAKWSNSAGVITMTDNGGPCPPTITNPGNNFLTGYNATTGTWTQAQPSFANISGSIATGQLVTFGSRLVSDFTSSSGVGTALQATGISVPLPSTAKNYTFHCVVMYSQATNVAGDQFGIGLITTAPTFASALGAAFTNTGAASPQTTGVLTGLASVTPTAVVTFQPAVTSVLGAYLDGTVETSGSGASTFNLYVANGVAADVIVVKRDSACVLLPY